MKFPIIDSTGTHQMEYTVLTNYNSVLCTEHRELIAQFTLDNTPQDVTFIAESEAAGICFRRVN
jgi:hypothetical protein